MPFTFLVINSDVKVAEQNKHKSVLDKNNPSEDLRVFTILSKNIAQEKNSEERKLCDLGLRDVLFPPDRFLELRFESGEEVVKVHDCVHKRVDDAKNGSRTPWKPLCDHIRPPKDPKMMIAVKKRKLRILFLKHNENLKEVRSQKCNNQRKAFTRLLTVSRRSISLNKKYV